MDLRYGPEDDASKLFAEAVAIMARLRAPGGCPWDREQTFASIQPYTLEEAYEVFDAIDRRQWSDLCEELGDLLLQVLFYAQIAAEAGYFGIAEVIASLNAKLIRRHPHVFPPPSATGTTAVHAGQGQDESAQVSGAASSHIDLPVATPLPTLSTINSAQVVRNWEAIKQREKAHRSQSESDGESASALDSVLRSLPALLEARKLGSRARKSGFDWPDVEGLFDKLGEETAELRQAIESSGTIASDGRLDGRPAAGVFPSEAVASEVGDLLFTTVNLARHLEVDPEFALRRSNSKFRRRFALMEAAAQRPLESLSAEELDALWNRVKAAEKSASPMAP
jgi:nucleoside triphosphate diphosphatase